MSQIKIHWPSKMRPLICDNNRIATSQRPWSSQTTDWSNLKRRTQRRTRWGKSWNKSSPNWEKWRSILSRKLSKMEIWERSNKLNLSCVNSEIKRKPNYWMLPSTLRKTRPPGWTTISRSLKWKTPKSTRKQSPSKTKWIIGRIQLLSSCSKILNKIESRIWLRFNSSQSKSGKLKATMNHLNNKINQCRALLGNRMTHSQDCRSKKMPKMWRSRNWLRHWMRRYLIKTNNVREIFRS